MKKNLIFIYIFFLHISHPTPTNFVKKILNMLYCPCPWFKQQSDYKQLSKENNLEKYEKYEKYEEYDETVTLKINDSFFVPNNLELDENTIKKLIDQNKKHR